MTSKQGWKNSHAQGFRDIGEQRQDRKRAISGMTYRTKKPPSLCNPLARSSPSRIRSRLLGYRQSRTLPRRLRVTPALRSQERHGRRPRRYRTPPVPPLRKSPWVAGSPRLRSVDHHGEHQGGIENSEHRATQVERPTCTWDTCTSRANLQFPSGT